MSTSGVTTYSLTANQMIEKAFHRLGKASEGEAVSARMYSDGMSSLNLILKSVMGTSDHLFLRSEASVTLVANQQSYALPTNVQRVLSVRRRSSDGRDIPMNVLSRQEYYDLPNKTSSPSVPVSYFFDPQRITETLIVWPVPDSSAASTYTLQYTYLRTVESMINSIDELDAPQEWLDPVIWILADDLETEYPVNDSRLAMKVGQKASDAKQVLDYWDTEMASLYIQPDAGPGF